MAKTPGKQFEEDMKTSASDQHILYIRIKDVFLPPNLRTKVRVPHNPFDVIVFYKGYLFPLEYKSTKGKSVSFSPKIIKPHQIENLQKAVQYEGTIPGFIFNFRTVKETYFVHINDFIKYKNIAEHNDGQNAYKTKINKSSIPIGICHEIGNRVIATKKRIHNRYYLNALFDQLIKKYGSVNDDRTISSPHTNKTRGVEIK